MVLETNVDGFLWDRIPSFVSTEMVHEFINSFRFKKYICYNRNIRLRGLPVKTRVHDSVNLSHSLVQYKSHKDRWNYRCRLLNEELLTKIFKPNIHDWSFELKFRN